MTRHMPVIANEGRWKGALVKLKDEVARSKLIDVASAAAFWLFLSLLPIATVAGMAVAKIQHADVSLFGPLLESLPHETRELIERELGRVASWKGGTVGPISALVFLWLASSGIHAILDAFDATTECERSWIRKRLVSIALCIALSIAIAAFGLFVGLVVRGALASSLLAYAPIRFVFAFAIEIVLIAGLFAGGIARSCKARMPLLPGALLAATLNVVLGFGYVQWIRVMGTGGAYQAGLATIGVTLTALWLFVLALLFGVVLNKLLGTRRASIAAEMPKRSSWEKMRQRLKWAWRHFLAQLDPKPPRRRRRRRHGH